MPHSAKSLRHLVRGFTLVELLIVIALVAALSVLSIQGFTKYRAYAQNSNCISRIKNLGAALGAYLTAKETWPQMPEQNEGMEEEKYFEWWIKELEPWGPAPSDWVCPTELSVWKQDEAKGGEKIPEYWGSYYPTEFEAGPNIPYKWKQPWLIERTDYHGMGQNVLMPDFSVQRFKNPTMPAAAKKK
ncbi:MAG: type II secretion system protein [Verrucomicrobiales bacterium]|nr:type II secretion system protein [Verrucomicrobiales bacterium]